MWIIEKKCLSFIHHDTRNSITAHRVVLEENDGSEKKRNQWLEKNASIFFTLSEVAAATQKCTFFYVRVILYVVWTKGSAHVFFFALMSRKFDLTKTIRKSGFSFCATTYFFLNKFPPVYVQLLKHFSGHYLLI